MERDKLETDMRFHMGRAADIAARLGVSLEEQLAEGAWTGSMGGNDPDFVKLKGGLKEWARKIVATDPHPFRELVKHLRKHVANPERLAAWLIDQIKGHTKWRNGRHRESFMDSYEPTLEELREAYNVIEGSIEPATTTSVQEAAEQTERDLVAITFDAAGTPIYEYSINAGTGDH